MQFTLYSNKMVKKAQSAIEFMILVGAVILFFISFLFVIQGNISGKVVENRNLVVKEIAFTVVDELNLAMNSVDGYSRKFTLPEKIINEDYIISIEDGFVYVRTLDEAYTISLPVGGNVIGQPVLGENVISRQGGLIYLNI